MNKLFKPGEGFYIGIAIGSVVALALFIYLAAHAKAPQGWNEREACVAEWQGAEPNTIPWYCKQYLEER